MCYSSFSKKTANKQEQLVKNLFLSQIWFSASWSLFTETEKCLIPLNLHLRGIDRLKPDTQNTDSGTVKGCCPQSHLLLYRTIPHPPPRASPQPYPLNIKSKSCFTIDQFRYIKIQPKTIDLSMRLWGITTEFVGFIRQSLVLGSIVLG